jgi:hypothetical protein
MDAVVSLARASLATAGLTVVGKDLARPWGGFLLVSQSEVHEFIRAYFGDAGLQDAREQPALSPKLLLVAPGRRLSWQYHGRRSEIWRMPPATAVPTAIANTGVSALRHGSRTPGSKTANLKSNGFRDCRIQPLCHPSEGQQMLRGRR